MEYDWEPTLYYMSDGNEANDQFAFFEPTVYGADVSEDIYTVRGTYTFIDTGTQMDAEIDFNGDGDMQSVWGYQRRERSARAPGTRSPRSRETPSPSRTSTSSSTRIPTASSSTTTAAS